MTPEQLKSIEEQADKEARELYSNAKALALESNDAQMAYLAGAQCGAYMKALISERVRTAALVEAGDAMRACIVEGIGPTPFEALELWPHSAREAYLSWDAALAAYNTTQP